MMLTLRRCSRILIVIGAIQLIILIYYLITFEHIRFWASSPPVNSGVWVLLPAEKAGDSVKKSWVYVDKSSINYNDLATEGQQATFMLLQRNLLLFSIREINLKLGGTPCTKWWANPLSIYEIEEVILTPEVTQYTLTFEAQPGRIPFQSTVKVTKNHRDAAHPYVSDDFVFVSGRRLDASGKCTARLGRLRKLCLCPEEKAEAERITQKIRAVWNIADPEHIDWPPDASAMVPDFLTLGKMDIYLKEPHERQYFCGSDIKLLIFVSSAPSHGERRDAIRNTFGNTDYLLKHQVRLAFTFGRFLDAKTQIRVEAEYKQYGDILQSDFKDHYQNQSLSELYFYNWLVTHCEQQRVPLPRWVMKADDDSFLNIPLILRVMEANPKAEIIGCQDCPHPVMRLWKAQVPMYMFRPEHWFGFVYGGAALMRSDIIRPLLKASLTCAIVNMNDCYITGILAKEIGAYPLNSPLFQTMIIVRETVCSKPKFMAITHVKTSQELAVHWVALHQPSSKDCPAFDENLLIADPVTPQKKLDCFFD